MNWSVRGRTVVVTGAASGIGRALAFAFARAGARVAVLDRDAEGASRVAAEIAAGAGSAMSRACDVTSSEQVAAAMAAVTDRFGGIDVLVNNAGVTQLGLFADTPLESYRRVFDINVFGAIDCTRAALPSIRERRGVVVAISSVAGFAPLHGRSGYSGSKHALHGLFGTLRCELAADGVQVMLVCPGFTDTSIEKNAIGSGPRPTVGAPASPESVAAAILAGIEARRPLLVLGGVGKASWWMTRLAPGLYERIMTRRMLAAAGR